jgi:rRNA maturation protein Rpf1
MDEKFYQLLKKLICLLKNTVSTKRDKKQIIIYLFYNDIQ